MAKQKWIQSINMEKGSLTAKAKAAGFDDVRAYCNSLKDGDWHKGVDAKTKRQCVLAKTLKKVRK